MYETFEHTADVGLRIGARTLDGLFAEAGRALMSVLVERPAAIEPRETARVALRTGRRDDLLHDWLAELLYLFSVKGSLLASCAASVAGTSLEAVIQTEPFDPARHGAGTEIKAVTYHGLRLEETSDGYLAEVILDL